MNDIIDIASKIANEGVDVNIKFPATTVIALILTVVIPAALIILLLYATKK